MSQSVTRIGKLGILGHLDELERLMREYKEVRISENNATDDLLRDLYLSSFLYWLQQRERQLVVVTTKGELDVKTETNHS